MAECNASVNHQSKISKLIHEKHLLNQRLITLQREYNPNSNSREQHKREDQIENSNRRLVEIDQELSKEKYELAKSERFEKTKQQQSLDELSNKLSNFSFEDKQKDKLGILKDFIDKSQENMTQTSDTKTTSADTITSVASSTANTISQQTQSEPSTSTASMTSSTPKQSTTKTTMSNLSSKPTPQEYNFPQTYESPENRSNRLKHEQLLREQFDRDVLLHQKCENSGTIPKRSNQQISYSNSRIPQISPQHNDSNRIPSQSEHITHNQDLYQQELLNRPIQASRNSDHNNESWNENPQRFPNYIPTPRRMKSLEQNFLNRNMGDLRHIQNNLDNESISNRNRIEPYRVSFDVPPPTHSGSTHINSDNRMNHRYENFNIPPNRQDIPRNSFLKRLKMIPKFNGETYTDLRDFLDICETLYYSCDNDAENQEFFEHFLLQLRGEARSLIKPELIQNQGWDFIKNKFLTHFEYLANKSVLQSQLENLHQEKKETLTEYTNRARKLLKERNAIYNQLSDEQRAEHNRIARRAFTKGIQNNGLREKMLIRGANSLEDAIAYAIEAENDSLLAISRADTFCRHCRTPGHLQKDCRQLENSNSDINKLANALRGMSTNSRPYTNNNSYRRNNTPNLNYNTLNRNYGQNRNYNNQNPNRNGYNNYQNNNYNNNNNQQRDNYGGYNGNQYRNNGNNYNQGNGYNNGNTYNRNQYQNQGNNTPNRNQNQNNNTYTQNRENSQQNTRTPQRNNFVRNARINTIQTQPEYVELNEQNSFVAQASEN